MLHAVIVDVIHRVLRAGHRCDHATIGGYRPDVAEQFLHAGVVPVVTGTRRIEGAEMRAVCVLKLVEETAGIGHGHPDVLIGGAAQSATAANADANAPPMRLNLRFGFIELLHAIPGTTGC
jgi:hypothetical protein